MAGVVLTPAVFLNALAGAVALGLAWYGTRHRDRPGAGSFIGMMLSITVWMLASITLQAVPGATIAPVKAVDWTSASLVGVFWLAFALEYTGQESFVSGRTLAGLSLLPGVTAAFILAGDPLDVMWAGACTTTFQPLVGYIVDPATCQGQVWYYTTLAYVYTLVLAGIALLSRMIVSYEAVYGEQAVSLLVGIGVPLVTSVAWALDLVPVPGFDPTPAAFAVSGIAFGNAIFRYGFMDVIPATRRIGESAAVADLKDGVIIVDDHDRVLTMNTAAGELFGVDEAAAVGKPVQTVVGDESLSVRDGEFVTELDSADGRRSFEITVSPVTDRHDRAIGHTLVLRDVTERQQRKQQLAALNRVLRHNLRNDMNVVQGYADTLSERTTDPEAEMAEYIAEQSSQLVEVGSKVRDMEKIMERPRSEYQRFEMGSLLRDVVDRVRADHPDVRFVTNLPPDLWLQSDDLVVGTVVENVVRNAAEHNDADAPEITVAVESDDGWTEIRVADNGPGIPDQEREALIDGEETDLRHGSGLGLWVVNWGVTKLGGDLSFDDLERGGTVVRVRLPGVTDAPDEGAGSAPGDAEASVSAD